MAKYTDKQALDELKRLIDEIDNVRKKPRLTPKFKAWKNEVSELLERLFGRSSKQVKEFDKIPYSLAAFSNKTPDSKFDEAFHQGLKTAAISLSSAVKEIQTSGVGGSKKQSSEPASSGAPAKPVLEQKEVSNLKSIKPVHSPGIPVVNKAISQSGKANNAHDVLFVTSGKNGVSTEIEDFLSKIGLTPSLTYCSTEEHAKLAEGINRFSDVGYAIVLLGYDGSMSVKDLAFGLGMLAGRYGPERVCAIVSDKMTGIDTYSGINYVPVDAAGAWKFMMIKNLKSAGFQVDANRAL